MGLREHESRSQETILRSSILCRVSPCVLDFIYLGIPNRISDIRHALAQLPAFLVAAHADAEAQAQAHMAQAQVQVSDVRNFDNYIRSPNSPIALG